MNIIILFISILFLSITRCGEPNTLHLTVTHQRTLLDIVSVSPDGRYAIINVSEMPETLTPFNIPNPMQIVLDIEDYQKWLLLDTTVVREAGHFDWAHNSKTVLFNSFRRPSETCNRWVDLYPIYLYDLQSRNLFDLEKPGTFGTAIPEFYGKKYEIIFYCTTLLRDTLSSDFGSDYGRILKFDTLYKSVVEVKKSDDLADVRWIQCYDTTRLYMARVDATADDIFCNALLLLNLSSGELEQVLPEIRIVSKITSFQDKIVFAGKSDQVTKVYVYDLNSESIADIVDYDRGYIVRAVINNETNFAVETLKDSKYWIYMMSKTGTISDSLKGRSPFWLGGADTLLYSEGKVINIAYRRNGELKKEAILEVVKRKS